MRNKLLVMFLVSIAPSGASAQYCETLNAVLESHGRDSFFESLGRAGEPLSQDKIKRLARRWLKTHNEPRAANDLGASNELKLNKPVAPRSFVANIASRTDVEVSTRAKASLVRFASAELSSRKALDEFLDVSSSGFDELIKNRAFLERRRVQAKNLSEFPANIFGKVYTARLSRGDRVVFNKLADGRVQILCVGNDCYKH